MLGCNTPEDPETEVSPSTEIEVLYDPTDMRPRPSALNAPHSQGPRLWRPIQALFEPPVVHLLRGEGAFISVIAGALVEGLMAYGWLGDLIERGEDFFLDSHPLPPCEADKNRKRQRWRSWRLAHLKVGRSCKTCWKKVAFPPSSWVQWKITNKWNPGNSYWRDHFPTEPWWLEEG